jgi:hypothetical protein
MKTRKPKTHTLEYTFIMKYTFYAFRLYVLTSFSTLSALPNREIQTPEGAK